MLRTMYVWLLRLHPSAFRQRYADEMLCIFDQTMANQAAKNKVWTSFRLLGDGVVSLLRQRMVRQWLRGAAEHDVGPIASDTATADALPVFYSLPSFKPSSGAMIYGAALSLFAFFVVFVAMRYSWTHRATIVLAVDSYAAEPRRADSPPSSSEGFQLPSVATYPDEADAPPQNPSVSQETTLPSRSETAVPATATEIGIAPASRSAGIAPAFHPRTVVRIGKPILQFGESTPDKSSTFVRPQASPAGSAYRNQIASETTSAGWLEPYIGTYVVDATTQEITVSAGDGNLEIRIAGQEKLSVVAASRTKFLVAGKTDEWIEFVQDEGGAFRELDLYRNGQPQPAHRRR